MTLLILFFCSLFFTFVFTPNLINFYKRNGILDKPGGRKIHINIVPSMGGVLIAVIGILVLSLYANQYEGFIYLMLSFLIITASGIFDDLFDIVCTKKFFIQNISSIFLLIFFSNYFNELILFGIELPAIANYILLHLFIVGSFKCNKFIRWFGWFSKRNFAHNTFNYFGNCSNNFKHFIACVKCLTDRRIDWIFKIQFLSGKYFFRRYGFLGVGLFSYILFNHCKFKFNPAVFGFNLAVNSIGTANN